MVKCKLELKTLMNSNYAFYSLFRKGMQIKKKTSNKFFRVFENQFNMKWLNIMHQSLSSYLMEAIKMYHWLSCKF